MPCSYRNVPVPQRPHTPLYHLVSIWQCLQNLYSNLRIVPRYDRSASRTTIMNLRRDACCGRRWAGASAYLGGGFLCKLFDLVIERVDCGNPILGRHLIRSLDPGAHEHGELLHPTACAEVIQDLIA